MRRAVAPTPSVTERSPAPFGSESGDADPGDLETSNTDTGHTVVVGGTASKRALFVEEDRAWNELHLLVDSLPVDKVDQPGYFQEGWSAKDLIAHIGSWLAEAGVVLERIRVGTYQTEEIDIDAMNQAFYDAMHDVPFAVVRAQGVAARNRMLRAWRSLPEDSSEADSWIRKAGPDHYAEHLPRLREWASELERSARSSLCQAGERQR